MHICYVVDARSPIAKNWISHFVARGHRVTVVSSYPCSAEEIPGAELIEFPFALSSLSRVPHNGNVQDSNGGVMSKVVAEFRSGRLAAMSNNIRTWIAPIDINRRTEAIANLIRDLQPDLVHAMRLPFEGFLAAAALENENAPLLLSVWGNDFTLFAARSRKLAKLAESALQRVDGLHCDCNRDLEIAFSRGFSSQKPWRVLPGNGGIDMTIFESLKPDHDLLREFGIPKGVPLVINPRGFRAYVRNDTFFRSIPLILEQVPEAFFVSVGMDDNPVAERWIRHMGIASSIRLLPTISREQLAGLLASSKVSVSPSSHDGTPNTLLEAMACGCFPVVGDVDSLREWITHGENGLICDHTEPKSLAACVVRSLQDDSLRTSAARMNRESIRTRANYTNVMAEAETLYSQVRQASTRALETVISRRENC